MLLLGHRAATECAPQDALLAYLSDVSNLPEYFPWMRHVQPTSGAEVHTEAELPGGQHLEGQSWFRADEVAQHIAWGAKDDDYDGYLDITETSQESSQVQVHLHCPREHIEVQRGLDQALATIKEKVEAQAGVRA